MKKAEILALIEGIAIIPAVRVYSAEDARFAAEAVSQGGIPIVEITMTVPGALHVISDLVKHAPDLVVGAGSVLDKETAHKCLDAGAGFLTTDGLDLKVVEYAVTQNIVVFPGALTPTEVLNAWKAGADLVKVVPCAQVGGDTYIKALKAPFPQIPLIAAGGVNQQTATNFILAGAVALGVGVALIPRESIKLRQADRIRELARRFVGFVETGRNDLAARKEGIVTGD
jgi:2-dehydro-3-deoxyphosphogluconate aldolase/(4S)-4-hydroxy-2-oxoglutarate aldolase